MSGDDEEEFFNRLREPTFDMSSQLMFKLVEANAINGDGNRLTKHRVSKSFSVKMHDGTIMRFKVGDILNPVTLIMMELNAQGVRKWKPTE